MGSDVADTRERAQALRATGATVRAAAIGVPSASEGHWSQATGGSPNAVAIWPADRHGFAALEDLAREGRYDLALVGSASPGGGGMAWHLPAHVPAVWWPTGLAAPGGILERLCRGPLAFGASLALGSRALPSIAAGIEGDDGVEPAGLSWSTVDAQRARRRTLPLWDGDFVLVPTGLGGHSGGDVLQAFAIVASEWSGVDLVVLAHPQPDAERRARSLEIGMRVHFVGPAPREAEWAWWSQAAAAVITGGSPVAGGLVLRGMMVGCPLLTVGSQESILGLGEWLGLDGGVHAARNLPAALGHLLERGPEVKGGIERGRAIAAGHDADAIADRLARALDVAARRSAPAAAAAA